MTTSLIKKVVRESDNNIQEGVHSTGSSMNRKGGRKGEFHKKVLNASKLDGTSAKEGHTNAPNI